MRSLLLGFALAALTLSCGERSTEDGTLKSQSEPAPPAVTPKPETPTVPVSGLAFVGYVLNAFEVSVDGEAYADLEDFYTKEVARLPVKVQAAGYGEEYKSEFDAGIGFADLWTDMAVYVSPMAKQGYQGTGRVGGDGKFSVSLPQDAADDLYRVRATKRIGITLTKDKEVKRICYNFSALEKSVPFGPKEKPIVLDAFQTSLTAYECSAPAGDGLSIPTAAKAATPSASPSRLLSPGLAKEEVLGILGRAGLRIDSTTKWCWIPDQSAEKDVCAVNYAADCACSVSFDEQGTLKTQDNINAGFLDVATW